MRKFTRRNRGPVVAAGLVLGTLVVGLAGTGWGLLAAREGAIAERAAKAEAVAEKEVAEAVRDFLQTRLLGQANVLAQANALKASGRPATAARPDVTVRELLDRAAGDLTPEAFQHDSQTSRWSTPVCCKPLAKLTPESAISNVVFHFSGAPSH